MSARIVYQDDLVTLYHARYRDVIDSARPAEFRADAVITDPPYGDETSLEWDRWLDGWLVDAAILSNALWCFGSFRMFHEHADEFAAWKYSQDVVWEKHNGSGFLNDRFRRVHEHAVLWYRGAWGDLHHETPTTPDAVARTVRSKAKPAHMGDIERTAYRSEDGGPRLMRSVIQARSEHGRAIHPTQKPLAAVSPLIEYSVPRGGLVIDFFAGSGTTAVAARQLGRRCIAFESDADYAEAAARRLAQQTFDLEGASA